MSFPGFPQEAVRFFRELRTNNDRAWFAQHKADYETFVKQPAEAFVEALRPELEALAGRPLGAKVFRLQRDVRFSKDKTPYNVYLRAGFMPQAGDHQGPGYYFGLEPERIMLGGGCFDLEGPTLDAYRRAVDDAETGAALARLIDDLAAQGFQMDAPSLKRVPAPYPADHPRGELLKRKGLPAFREAPIPATGAIADSATCLVAFRTVTPLHRWLEDALEAS
jgi:uncharacterized protein (TIGR02453 family)